MSDMTQAPAFGLHFPRFTQLLASERAGPEDEFGPPASTEEVEEIERLIGVALPPSYKAFLRISSHVLIWGGAFQMSAGSLFFHEYPVEGLTDFQRLALAQHPPPSEGMLCFADLWLDGDGDQALFDISRGLVAGEYPVFYYNHDTPSVRRLADGFAEFIERVIAAD